MLEINAVQALLLFNIGDNEVTAGELKTRGYYQGSNVSYNLKKLVEMGYMHHQRCEIDRRSVRVRLTQKGRDIRDLVAGSSNAMPRGCRARACSAATGSTPSPPRCAGWSATGRTRSAISTEAPGPRPCRPGQHRARKLAQQLAPHGAGEILEIRAVSTKAPGPRTTSAR